MIKQLLVIAAIVLPMANSSANTDLPRVIYINEHTKVVKVRVGDYLQVTCYHDYWTLYSLRGKLCDKEQLREYKLIHLKDPYRLVSIYKIRGTFDKIQLIHGANVVEALVGSIYEVIPNNPEHIWPAEIFLTVKHDISIEFVEK